MNVVASRLMWPRGLKCYDVLCCFRDLSRGLCGLVDWNTTWIVNLVRNRTSRLMWPRGLKYVFCQGSRRIGGSRLMWPRGLKFFIHQIKTDEQRRGLCGLVDWNEIITFNDSIINVEAYTASWIEIHPPKLQRLDPRSRLIRPRGLKF